MKYIILVITLALHATVKAGEVDASPLQKAYDNILKFCESNENDVPSRSESAKRGLETLSIATKAVARLVRTEDRAIYSDKEIAESYRLNAKTISKSCNLAIVSINTIDARFLDILLGFNLFERAKRRAKRGRAEFC